MLQNNTHIQQPKLGFRRGPEAGLPGEGNVANQATVTETESKTDKTRYTAAYCSC